VWSGRTKRVFVYTASLLIAPMLAMPYSKGSREFSLALMAWAVIMILSSSYVVKGEIKLKPRSLQGNKLLAASLITLLFGFTVLVGSIVYLSSRTNS